MSIDTFLLQHDAALRFGSMLIAFAVLAGWELFAPQRRLRARKSARWPHTIALAAINMAVVRVVFPVAAVLIAAAAERRGVGLLNVVQLPYPVAVLVGLFAFDLFVYFVHLAFHAAPALWRMHRLHHADTDVDVSTGLRFHPIQVVLSWLVNLAVVVLVGTPVLSVVLFEAVFHAIVLFNYANVVIRPGGSALVHRDSRDALRAPLGADGRDEQQLWLRTALVGQVAGDLPGSANRST